MSRSTCQLLAFLTRFKGLWLTLGLALAVLVPLTVSAQTVIDMTVENSRQTYNDAIFQQGPSDGSAGTGVIDPFLHISSANLNVVEGYNTDFRPLENQEVSRWTKSLLLSIVPEIEEGGVIYREFFLDINQGNPSVLSLDDIRLFVSDSNMLHGFDPATNSFVGGSSTLVWDLGDAYVKMDYALEPGSGKTDIRMYIPSALFGNDPTCKYGQPGCMTYVYLYSRFGNVFANNDGFEEWSTRVLPFVVLSKTADASVTVTYDWDITKDVDVNEWRLNIGSSETSIYTVAVNRTVTEGDALVSGTIDISVPDTLPDGDQNAQPAIIELPTDVISPSLTNATVSCPGVTFPLTLNRNDSLVCTYNAIVPAPVDGVNTVEVLVEDNPMTTTATAKVEFQKTEIGKPTVNVTDTNGESWGPVSGAASWTYSRNFACPTDPRLYVNGLYEETYNNTATITETGQTDSETVTLHCYAPLVSKSAQAGFTREYTWTIDKSVDVDEWWLFQGDSSRSNYTVTVDQTITERGLAASGTITVVNSNPENDMAVDLQDEISGVPLPVTLACGGSLVVPAGGSATCDYSADLPDESPRVNTVTVTLNEVEFTATADVIVGAPVIIGYPRVNVTDSSGETWTAEGDASWPYSRDFACPTDPSLYVNNLYEETYNNTATIAQTEQMDSEAVTIHCYRLSLEKTAASSYDRTWTWDIVKTGKAPDQGPYVIQVGSTINITIPYSVTVDASSSDNNYAVEGDIMITNPNPQRYAELERVVDVLGGTNVVPNCPSPLMVPAGGTLTCSYNAGLLDNISLTNTATATQRNYSFEGQSSTPSGATTAYSGSTSVVFGSTPSQEIDNCVDLTDNPLGNLGTVCANEAPKTLNFAVDHPVSASGRCTVVELPNTASFTTNTTGSTGQSTVSFPVELCPTGLDPVDEPDNNLFLPFIIF